MPSGGLVEHANARWSGAGSYQVGLPGISMRDLPRYRALVDWQVRSQHNGLAVAGYARNHALRFVPHGRQPIRPYGGEHGLLWLPPSRLAKQSVFAAVRPNGL